LNLQLTGLWKFAIFDTTIGFTKVSLSHHKRHTAIITKTSWETNVV
jgi:hypothetical protein